MWIMNDGRLNGGGMLPSPLKNESVNFEPGVESGRTRTTTRLLTSAQRSPLILRKWRKMLPMVVSMGNMVHVRRAVATRARPNPGDLRLTYDHAAAPCG